MKPKPYGFWNDFKVCVLRTGRRNESPGEGLFNKVTHFFFVAKFTSFLKSGIN